MHSTSVSNASIPFYTTERRNLINDSDEGMIQPYVMNPVRHNHNSSVSNLDESDESEEEEFLRD